jgi:D-alanine-D-alanine ligase
MLIALTHNLQLDSRDEDEAEFDRPETIAFLVEQLRGLGHEVEPVEVGGPIEGTIARLRALAPELVFNTAEGRRGRVREGLWPALFEELGLPYTGSDAFTCVLTLDKRMSKRLVAAEGVPTPSAQLVERLGDLDFDAVEYPAIVKPNFEGSSKGIASDSVVDGRARLEAKVATMLGRYPDGVLVERFIAGRDLTVAWLEGASPDTGGILPIAELVFTPGPGLQPRFDRGERLERADAVGADRPSGPVIYDYELKQLGSDSVHVQVPARLDPELSALLSQHTLRLVSALGLRDFARCDFRLDERGGLHFLEVNALPSLEPGSSLWIAAAVGGMSRPSAVLESILASASARYGLRLRRRRGKRARERLRVGVLHNQPRGREDNQPRGREDNPAPELDNKSPVEAIGAAIRELGHEPVLLEATRELPSLLPGARIDAAFNIAEGFAGRSREAQVPALLELLEIPYTGSDPACLALCLDKSLAKRVVALAGVATPAWIAMRGHERLPESVGFPAVVKPMAEGSSKGVVRSSVVHDEHELRAVVRELVAQFDQPALVETYLPGREFTIGLIGERRPRVLPAMEIVFTDPAVSHPVYGYGHKKEILSAGPGAEQGVRFEVPAPVDAALEHELRRVARRSFEALGCRDVARVDLRLDGHGRVQFIECNPLPGLVPGISDLCIVAEAAGLRYHELIAAILEPALRRLRAQRRGRGSTARTTGVGAEVVEEAAAAAPVVPRNQLSLNLPGLNLPGVDLGPDLPGDLPEIDMPGRDMSGRDSDRRHTLEHPSV